MAKLVVSAMYRFVRLEDYQSLKDPLLRFMKKRGIKGTLLLAAEGINGTVAGEAAAIDQLLDWLKSDPRLADLSHKESYADAMPFLRSKVKLKREIVTMGVDGIDPAADAGTYVDPQDWNRLIDDPEVLVVDTRNDYEVSIGSFSGAVNPGLDCFRQFPDYASQHLDPKRHRKVAMFCTGGIRCEKSTAYLKNQGFDQVYHLKGGILKYLEDVPAEESRWQGECFVFDNRVAVGHGVEPGTYDQCYACRYPITEEDKQSKEYQEGVSCPHCIGTKSDEQQSRYLERQRQVRLAKERGQEHIGA